MSAVRLTPRTNKVIQESILSPNLPRLERALHNKKSYTNLVKAANFAIEQGTMAEESPERLEARQKIYNFLVKKLPPFSRVKRKLLFKGGKQTRKNKKIKIPPNIIEEILETGVEIAAGGKQTRRRRKYTRKH
jgi:hypothetical protein